MQLLVGAAALQQQECLHRMCMYMPAILYILYVSVCQHTSLFTRGCVDLPRRGSERGTGGGGLSCAQQVSTHLCTGV